MQQKETNFDKSNSAKPARPVRPNCQCSGTRTWDRVLPLCQAKSFRECMNVWKRTFVQWKYCICVCVHALLRFPSQMIQTRCPFHSKWQCLHQVNNNVFVWLVNMCCIWVCAHCMCMLNVFLNMHNSNVMLWVEKNGLSNYLAICLQNFHLGLEALEDFRV